MIKRLLEPIYQTLFNYFVKKDGYSKVSHVFISLCMLILLLFVVADVLFLLSIIADNKITFKQNKGTNYLLIIILGAMNYVFLFHLVKIEKEGDGDQQMFPLDPTKSKKILRRFAMLIGCTFLLGLWYIFL